MACGKVCQVIGLLTLSSHRDGIWLTKLETHLQALGHRVEVLTVENLDVRMSSEPQFDILVNRVSDAAPPADAKATTMYLRYCELLGIPVYNGSQAYLIGQNKLLHHRIFDVHKMRSPLTHFVRTKEDILRAAETMQFPILLKPNAGGFSAGIMVLTSREELETRLPSFPLPEGRMLLIQEYLKPKDNELFRAWFLAGGVHCALKTVLPEGKLITSTCAASSESSCALLGAAPKQRAVTVTDSVSSKIAHVFKTCSAQCGSIEFLFTADDPDPVYFDLNMLSTLPSRTEVQINGHDPWDELSFDILKFARAHKAATSPTSL